MARATARCGRGNAEAATREDAGEREIDDATDAMDVGFTLVRGLGSWTHVGGLERRGAGVLHAGDGARSNVGARRRVDRARC